MVKMTGEKIFEKCPQEIDIQLKSGSDVKITGRPFIRGFRARLQVKAIRMTNKKITKRDLSINQCAMSSSHHSTPMSHYKIHFHHCFETIKP